MKTTIKLISMLTMIHIFMITSVFAQVELLNENINHENAIEVLQRTAKAIVYAYEQVEINKKYTGNLSKAIKHQQIAKQLVENNDNYRAIHHSREARVYAFKAIRYNKGVINSDWNFTNQEQKLFGEGISDIELNKELLNTYPNDAFLDEKLKPQELKNIEIN